jgi:hypothetical protein
MRASPSERQALLQAFSLLNALCIALDGIHRSWIIATGAAHGSRIGKPVRFTVR